MVHIAAARVTQSLKSPRGCINLSQRDVDDLHVAMVYAVIEAIKRYNEGQW